MSFDRFNQSAVEVFIANPVFCSNYVMIGIAPWLQSMIRFHDSYLSVMIRSRSSFRKLFFSISGGSCKLRTLFIWNGAATEKPGQPDREPSAMHWIQKLSANQNRVSKITLANQRENMTDLLMFISFNNVVNIFHKFHVFSISTRRVIN